MDERYPKNKLPQFRGRTKVLAKGEEATVVVPVIVVVVEVQVTLAVIVPEVREVRVVEVTPGPPIYKIASESLLLEFSPSCILFGGIPLYYFIPSSFIF